MATEDTDATSGCCTAEVVAREVKALHGVQIETLTPPSDQNALVAILPDGKTLTDLKPILDHYLAHPERRRGTAVLVDADSFIKHVDRFESEESAVFALPDLKAPKLLAVYDYHPEGEDPSDADWMQHRAVYAPQLSEEWKAWAAKNGQPMNQAEFASFLEDHVTDVVVPNLDDPDIATFAALVQGRFAEPSDLLALSRGLTISVDSRVKNAVSLSTGAISVQYEETQRDGAGAPIDIANLFQICIPVFYAGKPYRIPVRLRFRVNGPALTWSYLMVRTDLVFDSAFRAIVNRVDNETKSQVFLGSPEA